MLISIIIPVYNVAPYIERCLASVKNQTYTNFEVLIIDDCGADNSIEIAEDFIKTDQRFRIIKHDKNRGLSVARNTGIAHSVGEYLFFLDSDDEIFNYTLDKLFEKASKFNSELVVGDIAVSNPKYSYSLNSNVGFLKGNEIFDYLIKHKWYVMAWNKLVRRDFLITNNLFFEEGIYHEDELWSFCIALKAQSMSFCYEKTYLYYIHPESISKKPSLKSAIDLNIVLQKINELIETNEIPRTPSLERYLISTAFSSLKKLTIIGYDKHIYNKIKEQLPKKYYKHIFSLSSSLRIRVKAGLFFLPYRLSHILCSIFL